MNEKIPPPSAEVMAHARRERFRGLIDDVFCGGVMGCRWGRTLFAGSEMAVELRRFGFGEVLDHHSVLLTRRIFVDEERLVGVWLVSLDELVR